jgi:tetratricopeptide (TPR) repeat protein
MSLAASASLLRAIALLRAGQRRLARVEVTHTVQRFPGSAPVRIAAARLLFVLRDYGRALEELDRAAALGAAEAALDVKFDLSRRLEWNHDALDAVSRGLSLDAGRRAAPGLPLDPRRRKWHAETAKLLARTGHEHAALVHVGELLAADPGSVALRLQQADLLLRAGADGAQATETTLQALDCAGITLEHRVAAARLLMRAGAFDDAEACLRRALTIAPACAPAHALLGELRLWWGDADAAAELAEAAMTADPSSADGIRVRGAARVLAGDPDAGLADLDRAIALDPGDATALLWRAQARFQLGQLEACVADIDRSVAVADGYFLAASILRLLATLRATRSSATLSDAAYSELFEGALRLCPGEEPTFRGGAAQGIAQVLERALAALRGNRTTSPTHLLPAAGVLGPRLARVPVSTAPRHASRRAMQRIRASGEAEVLRGLDEVIDRFPRSALPLCHRGELHLWLGHYMEARADLEAAIARHTHTRWAYIGLTALDIVEGHPARALETCARGVQIMGGTTGPAVFVHRGEAHRLLGHDQEARSDLERACDLHPARVSAWVNLGLLHGSAGDSPAQAAIFARLRSQAPGLLSDAAAESRVAIGDDEAAVPAASIHRVLEASLAMMRGNRSSGCVTYFTRSGRLRLVPSYPTTGARPSDRDEDDLRRLCAMLEAPARRAARAP